MAARSRVVRVQLPSSSLGEVDMAWHVDITWHNVWGLLLSLTLPGHYWLTLMDHALMLVLGKGVAATVITAPVRRPSRDSGGRATTPRTDHAAPVAQVQLS